MQQNVSLTYSALKWLLVVLLTGLSLGAVADSKLYFIHSDHLGTPQVMTDASQRVVWTANYMPFGEAEVDEDPDGDGVAVEMPLRFPGQYFDKETGLHYNYYRDYDPTLGRYIQPDPIGLRGGINTYNYVLNNPLIYTDPTGEIALPVAIIAGGLLGAAAVLSTTAGQQAWQDFGNSLSDRVRDLYKDDASAKPERTPEDEAAAQADHDWYKNQCETPPLETGDYCTDLKNKMNHALLCADLMAQFDKRWNTPGRHDPDIVNWQARYRRLKREYDATCSKDCP